MGSTGDPRGIHGDPVAGTARTVTTRTGVAIVRDPSAKLRQKLRGWGESCGTFHQRSLEIMLYLYKGNHPLLWPRMEIIQVAVKYDNFPRSLEIIEMFPNVCYFLVCVYPLVIVYIAVRNHHVYHGKAHYKWPFGICLVHFIDSLWFIGNMYTYLYIYIYTHTHIYIYTPV